MTEHDNVRLEDTGVTHAKAIGERAITRCGIEYDRLQAPLFDLRPLGVETTDDVDCMTCLTKDAATNADPRVIRTAYGIKDLRYRRGRAP